MIQHISVRVPWHDNGWDGTICQDPAGNSACLKLKNIAENRNDRVEIAIRGERMEDHMEKVCCIAEGGAFMSPEDLTRKAEHPYVSTKTPSHSHLLPTSVVYPAYSFPTRPFAWLMRDWIKERAATYGVGYDDDREPEMRFTSNWVQDGDNHKAIFDYFYGDVYPEKSLCLAYAKQVPFTDDHRRVILGMGHVRKIIPAKEYDHTDAGQLRPLIWETMVCHTIRSEHKDGFLIPYQEMQAYADEHPEFDMESIIVYAPAYAMPEFSYATEHVSYDAVIDVILSCIKSFTIINECLDEDYSNVLSWLNSQLAEVWEERGAFPGLGPMLCAFGVKQGVMMAREMQDRGFAEADVCEWVDHVMATPQKYLSSGVVKGVTPILRKTWKSLGQERRTLFTLLARFTLSLSQAEMLFEENERRKNGLECSDAEIIANPYLLYEETRLKLEGSYIDISTVDKAVFPVSSIAVLYPLAEPTKLASDNDERRVRALAIAVLEAAAQRGHTFLPCNMLVDWMQKINLDPPCKVTSDMVAALEKYMEQLIMKREMQDGTEYYKLVRLHKFDQIIEKRVRKRLKAEKIEVRADWRSMLDAKFNSEGTEKLSIDEERARQEKAAVLNVLAESRLSVLVGNAGTGKTTVLSVLCSEDSIRTGGVLLLAPTGKATVRLKESVGSDDDHFVSLNVAQYLVRNSRFDWNDLRYKLARFTPSDVPETVIIDEASMLTEEMFGAILDAVGRKAKRIIFVGDPDQLPPIGAGKPFVDLVNLLKEKLQPGKFPRTCECYGELIVNRRQQQGERLDVALSKYFTRTEDVPDDDDVLAAIQKGKSKNISIERWNTREELESKLLDTVSAVLGLQGPDDVDGFNRTFGADVGEYVTFFNADAATHVDDWEVLAPVRNMPHGVQNINNLFHQKYRQRQMDMAKAPWRSIPKAMGDEGIVYGDKVINVQNKSRKYWDVADKANHDGYVANGELGLVCGLYARKKRPKYMHVVFSSQNGRTYSFDGRDFNDEDGTHTLELAYALTIHKAQGSQFKTVILVLPATCRIASRELMYTAMTRQIERIIILYQGEPYQLLQYADEANSDIARRFTDLFADVFPDNDYKPQIVEVKGTFFDERLIHKTVRGELVRSKSEVIIANALFYNDIDYEYEPVLEVKGHVKRPDFKILDGDTGKVWYWEHCGMMTDPRYRKHWDDKKKFYEKNGIVEGKNLIVTMDDEQGGLDASEIDELIKETFDL